MGGPQYAQRDRDTEALATQGERRPGSDRKRAGPGNQALLRRLRAPPEGQPPPPNLASNRAAAWQLQCKLRVGGTGDPLEQQADRVADTFSSARPSASGAARQHPTVTPSALTHGIAAARGGGAPLPTQLRSSFESGLGADLGGVRVHTDERAGALAGGLGARAFTTRSDLFFAPGAYEPASAAGRWLLAHELTHVVQQGGDTIRRHPDADALPLGVAPAGAVQCYFAVAQAQLAGLAIAKHKDTTFTGHDELPSGSFLKADKTPNRVTKAAIPDLLVSDDGKMAIEHVEVNTDREVEQFFVAADVFATANQKLNAAKAGIDLKCVRDGALTVPDLTTDTMHALKLVVAQEYKVHSLWWNTHGASGADLASRENCNEMAAVIVGSALFKLKLPVASPEFNQQQLGLDLTAYLAGYIEGLLADEEPAACAERAGTRLDAAHAPLDQAPYIIPWRAPTFKVVAKSQEKMTAYLKALGEFSNATAAREQRSVVVFQYDRDAMHAVEGGDWELEQTVGSRDFIDWQTILALPKLAEHLIGAEFIKETDRVYLDKAALAVATEARKTAAARVLTDNPALLEAANRQLKMNEHAAPEIAEAYQIVHKGDGGHSAFPYHFAGVVARSGLDSVTFENYARADHVEGGDKRMYFQMYGPRRKVDIADKVRREVDPDEAEELAAGSFHGRWESIFVDAQTITVGK